MLILAFASPDEACPRPTGAPVNVWRTPAGDVFARGFRTGSTGLFAWDRLGLFAFEAGSRVVRAWPAAGARPDTVRDMFHRVAQPVIAQALGWQALHGSAAVGSDGAVVFCGLGHAGKSTLAYALARTPGWHQVADDAVVLGPLSDWPTLQLIPFRPKLRPPSVSFFEEREGVPPSAWPTPGLPGSGQVPLRAIIILSQSPTAPELSYPERVAPATAFTHVLRHAHSFDPADPQATAAMVRTYLELVSRIPVLRLTYRANFDRLPALVESVVRAARAASGHRTEALAGA
jgi:hypothetical protein